MKKRHLIITAIVCFGTLLGGCSKYLDINENPNGVATPSEASLLAGATNTTALNVFNISDFTGNYVQYLASPSPGSAYDIYDDVDGSGNWEAIYNTMSDLRVLHDQALGKGLEGYVGISDILIALNLNIATNVWGDIPYSQAFTGEFITPVFDDQKAIYDTCLQLIDQGIAALEKPDAGSQLSGGSDFIHGGNLSAWIKTGYALRARMLTQVSKTSQYNPQAVLDALAKAYTSNSDDAQMSSFDNGNPWYNIAYNNFNLVLGGWLSSYFIDATNGAIYDVFDPRLPLITETTEDGKYRGTPNGKGYQGPTNTEHYECYIDMNKWYSKPASPILIITNAECRFMEAEAAFRSGKKDEAYKAYLEGIEASMQKLGVAAFDMDAYMDNPAVAVGKGNLTLALIMKEKYVACFLNPVTWDDMRRTDYGYKGFKIPDNAKLSSFIRRVNYPDVTFSRNAKNVPQGVKLSDHLWWDQ